MSNVQRRDSSIQQDKRLLDRVYDLELWRKDGGGGGGGGTGPAGPAGPTGPAGLVWRGAWNAATAYDVNDAVTYLGSSYRRKVLGTTATSPALDAANWDVIALKGTDGAAASAPMDLWHQVGTAGEPAFQNGWVNYGGATNETLAFRKYPNGKVRIRGLVKNGGGNTIVFTLPVGYRPNGNYVGTVSQGHNGSAYIAGMIDVYPTGEVRSQMTGISPAWVRIDTEFDTDSVTSMPVGPKGDKGDPGAAPAAVEPWHLVGTAGEPAFNNNWTNFDASRVVKFRKFPDGKVKLTGVMKVTSGAVMYPFVLPVGYRPLQSGGLNWIVSCSGGTATVTIEATGQVQVAGNAGANPGVFCFVDGIEFDTESVVSLVSGFASPIDGFHTVGAVGEPAFQNNYGPEGAYTVRFRKDPFGKVKLSGVLNISSATGTVAFTLPVGYRPTGADRAFVCQRSGGTCLVYVNVDGTVNISGASTAWDYIYIDPVEFDTETVTNFVVGAVDRQDIEFVASSNVAIPVYTNDRLLTIEFEFVTSTYAATVYMRPNNDATARMATYLGQQTTDTGGGGGAVTALANAQARLGLVVTFNIGTIGQLRTLGRAEINLRDATLPRMWKADFTYANTLGSANHNETELKTTYRLPANTPAQPITTINIVPDTGTITGIARVRR